MKTRLMIACVLLAMGARAAFAEAALDEASRLDEKQAQLTERLARIEKVGKLHGRLVLLRDTLLLGDSGIATRAARWFDQIGEWVARWHALLQAVEGSSPAGLTVLAAQEEVRRLLASQAEEWRRLKEEAVAIELLAAQAAREAERLSTLPEEYVPGYEAQIRALDSHVESLQVALRQAGSGFASRRHEEWDQILPKTEQSVMGRLRRAMLLYPDLERAVARVGEFFQAERDLEPLVDAVEREFSKLESEVMDQRYFHAVRALDRLREVAASSRRSIDALAIDAEFSGPARQRVSAMLEAGEGLFQEATRSFTPGALLGSYAARKVPLLVERCRDAKERMTLNCELLGSLLTIPAESYLDLDLPMLQYLEYQFDQVEAGPLADGGAR